MLRTVFAALLLIPLACLPAGAAEKHRLALQISDNDPAKMNAVLNVAPNVSFMACENTLEAMARNEGKEPPLVENAERVKAGVVTLIELGEKGWTIVRP